MKLAASTVLFRTKPTFEVLVIKRSQRLKFLSGYTAFPGGMVDAVDEADTEIATAVNCGLRELAEELGLDKTYTETLRESLVHIGTWTTPEYLVDNFETYFFAVEVDTSFPQVVPNADEVESFEWIHPNDLAIRWEQCACLLAPPTQVIMRRLGEKGALEKLDEYSETKGVPPRYAKIRPYITLFPQYSPTLPPATHTNCYLIGHDELLIVEPATSLELDQSALRLFLEDQIESGKRLKAVVLTHHHHDHVSGVAEFVAHFDVEVWAHPATAERIPLKVERLLEDGDVIELDGGVCLEVFHTPGHAPGHIVLLDERSLSLIAGDMVAGIGSIIIDPEDAGDMAAYLDSLRLIKELEPTCLLPSHGPVIGGAEEKIDEYMAHRLMREALIREAVGVESTSIDAIVASAYKDTPEFFKVGPNGGLAGRSALAHLNKLVEDGEITGQLGDGFCRT